MSSGQWDLQALEAIEREASEIFDVLDVPERLRSPKQQLQCAGGKKTSPCRPFCGEGNRSSTSSPVTDENVDLELQDHIKHCSCSCNHMGYGNYMDYQVRTTGAKPRRKDEETSVLINRRKKPQRFRFLFLTRFRGRASDWLAGRNRVLNRQGAKPKWNWHLLPNGSSVPTGVL